MALDPQAVNALCECAVDGADTDQQKTIQAVSVRREALRALSVLVRYGCANGVDHILSKTDAVERLFRNLVGEETRGVLSAQQLEQWLKIVEPRVAGKFLCSCDGFP